MEIDAHTCLNVNMIHKAKLENELFIRHFGISFKGPTLLLFLLLSKIKMNKNRISSCIMLLSLMTMQFHPDVVVHCR